MLNHSLVESSTDIRNFYKLTNVSNTVRLELHRTLSFQGFIFNFLKLDNSFGSFKGGTKALFLHHKVTHLEKSIHPSKIIYA